MAKKINGIKIYPKHSVGSILSAAFCMISGVIIIFGVMLMPAFSVNSCAMSGFDFSFYSLNKLIFNSDSFLEVSNSLHLINPEGFNRVYCIDAITACENACNSSENIAVSWFGNISEYLIYGIGLSSLLVVFLGVFLFIKGLIRVILGTYPKYSKLLSLLSFIFLFVFCLGIFALSFCVKHLAMEVYESGLVDFTYDTVVYCPWPYIAWGTMLVCFTGQCWIKTLAIKDKLYVAGARKIKKSREIAN